MAGCIDEIGARLIEGCAHLEIPLDDNTVLQLQAYVAELQHWNKKINLVSKKATPQQIVETHFLDSLTLLPYLEVSESMLLDVGTGAGFPGLVCGVAEKKLLVKLVEPRLKRVSFLNHIIRKFDLENLEVISRRIEETEEKRFCSRYIVSRAVTGIEDFLHLVSGFADSSTEIICMKGPKWHEELTKATPFLDRTGMDFDRVEQLILPFSGAERALLFFKKRCAE